MNSSTAARSDFSSLVGDAAVRGDVLLDLRMGLVHEAQQALLEIAHPVEGNVVQEPARAGEDADDLLRERHRLVLRLLEQLRHALAAVETVARALVEVGRELCERRQLAILGEVESQLPGDLLHRLGLRVTTDARDREADVDRGRMPALNRSVSR